MKWWIPFVAMCLILLVLAGMAIYVITIPKRTYLPASKYDDLLHRLRAGNHTFILVHDCDYRIEGLQTLLAVEKIYNARSTCFVRPDAEYLSYSIAYLQKLEGEGWSIGFHYDCLSRSRGNWSLAMTLFRAQLTLLRAFFNITQTRYHGDGYNLSIGNRELYHPLLWREMGLTEVSELQGYSYITDVNATWTEPKTLNQNVLVNLHSDWW